MRKRAFHASNKPAACKQGVLPVFENPRFENCIICGKLVPHRSLRLHTNACLDFQQLDSNEKRKKIEVSSQANERVESGLNSTYAEDCLDGLALKSEAESFSGANITNIETELITHNKEKEKPGIPDRFQADFDASDEYDDEIFGSLKLPDFNFLNDVGPSQSKLAFEGGKLKTISSPESLKCAPSILQPGMVLFRNALAIETQQELVQATQEMSKTFKRLTTAGGGKYHVYSSFWGPKWDSTSHKYGKQEGTHPIPLWISNLAQEWAMAAHKQSPVLPEEDEMFAPDAGFINFYPARDSELGKIGIGGHQDLDNARCTPVVHFLQHALPNASTNSINPNRFALLFLSSYVAWKKVSVSIGDSMEFYYRRLPPFHRRKSGVLVRVDPMDMKSSRHGDNSNNQEKVVVLNSGDVLVFGGPSRLVFHGTRNLRIGTKPAALKMCPGRLNFTFRQRD